MRLPTACLQFGMDSICSSSLPDFVVESLVSEPRDKLHEDRRCWQASV